MRFTDTLRDSSSFEVDLVKAIQSDRGSARTFEAYYYALRMCATSRLIDMQHLIKCLPLSDYTWSEWYALGQLQAVFKKRADIRLGIDTVQEAKDCFLKSELLCKSTNDRLRNVDDVDYQRRATLLYQMSRKISTILGDIPELHSLAFGFGPGQNVGCGEVTNVMAKLNCSATATVEAAMLLKDAWGDFHVNWPGLRRLEFVKASRFSTVPKTWKTDRPICVEPILNTFLQKGIGRHIRDRLRCFGVNLNDQSRNRSLALQGSRDGSLATIDLSMASDLIAFNVVMDLLPFQWFDLLCKARTPFTSIDGTLIELEKFSAMGNGYTFELESLIFFALLKVIVPPGQIVSVYGDDLICPTEYYDQVTDALRLLGFIPNDDKSFKDGPFRESCGGDYLGGTSVRPIFQKEKWTYRDLFRWYNLVSESGYLPTARRLIYSHIPLRMRCWGPKGDNDGYLQTDILRPRINKRGISEYVLKQVWQVVPWQRRVGEGDAYSAFLYYTTFKHVPDSIFESYGYCYRPKCLFYRRRKVLVPYGVGL